MIVLKNLAESFITSAISDTATEITVPADHADLFPNLLDGDHFRCALVNPATAATEFINVTARNGNVLTVSRGEEGVAALPFPVESRIHLRMTAATWEEMAGECWMRPKDVGGEMVIPQFVDSNHFSLAGDYRDFFKTNRAIKAYPDLSVGFVESAVFADNLTTVRVIEMVVPDTLSHIEAGLDPDALAKRTLSNEELLGYMTPVPVLTMEALEVDGGTLVNGTISHPEADKAYPDSTEFHFSLPDNVTDFELTGLNFKLRVPVITEENSPQSVGPITCRAAQMSLILSNSSNPITFSVRYVAIKAGVTLGYADTQSGYPNADVNNEGAKLPACTVGLNNPSGKSIVSGRPEFEIMGAELDILEATDKSIKVAQEIKEGDELIFDNGEGVAGAVKVEGVDPSTVVDILADGSCRSFFPFEDTPNDLGPNAAHINATGTYTAGKFGKAATFPTATDDMSVPFNSNSVSFSWYTKFTTDHFYSVFQSSAGNIGLNWAINENNYFSYALGNNAYRTEYGDLSWMIDDGAFHHIVMTFSATETKLYVDNKLYYALPYTPAGTAHTMTRSSIMEPEPLDSLRVFNKPLTTEEVNILFTGALSSSVDISSAGLTSAPTKAFKKPVVGATIGTGATDEPINPETGLTLGEGSTNSKLILTSDTSIKNKIDTDDSIHKKIKCDDQDIAVESVSEEVSSVTVTAGTIQEERVTGWSIGSGSVDKHAAIRFPATYSKLNFVKFSNGNTSTVNFTLKLYSDNDGKPGTLLYTGPTVETIGTADIVFNLAEPQTLVAGTNYWVILYHNSGSADLSTVSTPAVLPYMMGRGSDIFNFTEDITSRGMWKYALGYLGDEFITTVNLTTPLAKIPTTVALPSCFTIPSAIESCTISGSALKFTGAKVDISDPAVKRLALKVIGDDSLRVKAAKIYTEEGA